MSVWLAAHGNKKLSASAHSGTDGDAPFLVTAIAAARAAMSIACAAASPFSNAAIKYPVKVSPAAVVSTAFTL